MQRFADIGERRTAYFKSGSKSPGTVGGIFSFAVTNEDSVSLSGHSGSQRRWIKTGAADLWTVYGPDSGTPVQDGRHAGTSVLLLRRFLSGLLPTVLLVHGIDGTPYFQEKGRTVFKKPVSRGAPDWVWRWKK